MTYVIDVFPRSEFAPTRLLPTRPSMPHWKGMH